MKQFFSFVVLLSIGFAISIRTAAAGSGLYEHWKIELPHVSLISENNTIVMDYGVSESITRDNIRAEIFTESCEYPRLTEGILSESLNHRGEHAFRIDPRILSKNPNVTRYDFVDFTANMTFCLHFMLWTGPESDGGAILINELETILIIDFNLRANALMGFSVAPKDSAVTPDRGNLTEREGFDADGYLCDPITYERTEVPEGGFNPGEIICVCALLNPIAIEEGLYLKGIEEFLWIRERYIGSELVTTKQYSVKDGVASPDGLTEYECIREDFCVFSTMLQTEFYLVPGYIYGSGQIKFDWLSLADDETRAKFGIIERRELRTRTRNEGKRFRRRSLQTSGISLSLPVSNGRSRPGLAVAATVFSARNLLWWCAGCWVAGSLLLLL